MIILHLKNSGHLGINNYELYLTTDIKGQTANCLVWTTNKKRYCDSNS